MKMLTFLEISAKINGFSAVSTIDLFDMILDARNLTQLFMLIHHNYKRIHDFFYDTFQKIFTLPRKSL